MIDFARARLTMVDTQLRPNGIIEQRLLAAILDVPREAFVDASRQNLAYLDDDIALDAPGAGQRYLMEPMIFGKLLQLADIRPTDKVMEIGTGTGYGAAVLARLAASVVALEENEGLAARAQALLADTPGAIVMAGPLGLGALGPFNAIIISGAVDMVPEEILDQLAEGGRLVAVVGQGGAGKGTLFRRDGGKIVSRIAFDAAIPPLKAFARKPEFVF